VIPESIAVKSNTQEIQSVLLPENSIEFFKSPFAPLETALILQKTTYAKYAIPEVNVIKNKRNFI